MKKTIHFITFLLLATVAFLNNGCNDDLNLVEFGEEKPIIYGFISMADTATYFRVERSFVDTKRGAPEIAQIPDSLYYTNATVTLVKLKSNERFVMQKVDGNKEGYPREDGPFAKAPNWLYKVKNNILDLKADESYRVEVQKAGAKEAFATATTKIIGTYEVFNPDPRTPMVLENIDRSFNVGVSTEEKSAKIYAIRVVFNYEDISTSGQRTPRNVKWEIVPRDERKGVTAGYEELYFRKSAKEFYEFLGRAIPPPNGVARNFISMDIEMDAGGQEFLDALNVNIANLGITGSQTLPTYSNIRNLKGDVVVGYGIVSSRNRFVRKGVLLNSQSLDFLRNGDLTKALNFR